MSVHGDFLSEFDEDGLSLEENTNFTQLSPYLNFDPSLLPSEPEYIYLYGNHKRGRFEHSFYNIGSSWIVGAALGGCRGFYNGLYQTTLAGQTGRIKKTGLLNHIMKQGGATANTLGSITFMYSGLGLLLQFVCKIEDEIHNSLTAATLTGLLYRLPGGMSKSLVGGAVGLGLASLCCLFTSVDRRQNTDDEFQLPTSSTPLLFGKPFPSGSGGMS